MDTMPAVLSRLQAALEFADVFVTPVRASPLDIQTIDPVLELTRSNPFKRLVVLNGTVPGSEMSNGARKYLTSRDIELWEQEISYDDAHPLAMLSGRTASELDANGGAAIEIQALWARVHELLRRATPRRRRRPAKGERTK
jgi:cellulose biosynthesis protein BcsQ